MLQRLKSRSSNFQGMRRVNYFDEESEEEESDSNEEQLVLQIDGNGSKPFYMKEPCVEIILELSSILGPRYLFLQNEI